MSPAQTLEHTARAVEMAIGKKAAKQAMLGKTIGWMFQVDHHLRQFGG